jgi:hypothetical protein
MAPGIFYFNYDFFFNFCVCFCFFKVHNASEMQQMLSFLFTKSCLVLVSSYYLKTITHWPRTLTIFCCCSLLTICTVIVIKYFVWKSKYYFVYMLLRVWQMIPNLKLLSLGDKRLNMFKNHYLNIIERKLSLSKELNVYSFLRHNVPLRIIK